MVLYDVPMASFIMIPKIPGPYCGPMALILDVERERERERQTARQPEREKERERERKKKNNNSMLHADTYALVHVQSHVACRSPNASFMCGSCSSTDPIHGNSEGRQATSGFTLKEKRWFKQVACKRVRCKACVLWVLWQLN